MLPFDKAGEDCICADEHESSKDDDDGVSLSL